MYVLNKIVGALIDPLVIGVFFAAVGLILRRKAGPWLVLVGLVWLGVWSSPAFYGLLARSLEGEFPVQTAESLPQADAIVALGGGMGANTNASPYAEMWTGADRIWHAARLYHAGLAPLVICTGTGSDVSSQTLLADLGVPTNAVVFLTSARNTEEEARHVQAFLAPRDARPRLLLVTSAFHMRRALLMYQKYAPGLDVAPAATDYDGLSSRAYGDGFSFKALIPDANALSYNKYLLKEIVAYWAYRLLR